MLTAKLNSQRLSVIYDRVVSDSIKYLKVKFEFDNSWDGYTKTAIFSDSKGTALSVVLLEGNALYLGDNCCYVPAEVISPPHFCLSVFGVLGDSIITSDKVKITVAQSGYEVGDEPLEPTSDIWQQIISIASSAQSIASSVRQDADNGVFNGDKGDQGQKGDKGDKGDKGEDGITPLIDQAYTPESENAQSGKAVAEAMEDTKQYVDSLVGDIETALDGIIAIQNELIGGEEE